jgi:hypothetical protein
MEGGGRSERWRRSRPPSEVLKVAMPKLQALAVTEKHAREDAHGSTAALAAEPASPIS